jgi:hypothetical protein
MINFFFNFYCLEVSCAKYNCGSRSTYNAASEADYHWAEFTVYNQARIPQISKQNKGWRAPSKLTNKIKSFSL